MFPDGFGRSIEGSTYLKHIVELGQKVGHERFIRAPREERYGAFPSPDHVLDRRPKVKCHPSAHQWRRGVGDQVEAGPIIRTGPRFERDMRVDEEKSHDCENEHNGLRVINTTEADMTVTDTHLGWPRAMPSW